MSPTPPFDSPPSHPPRGTRALPLALRQTFWWVVRLLLWSAAIVSAALAGGPLALIGLAGVALVAALALLGLGAFGWRRAGLPLALTAAALAISAAAIATQPTRLDRSHGLLIAAPRTPAEATSKEYRRGHGSVVIDLRRFRAPAGTTTTIRAQSDDGDVVVALPRDRCFALSVTYGERQLPTDGVRGLALAGLIAPGLVSQYGWSGVDFRGAYSKPDATFDVNGAPVNLVAFARTPFVPQAAASPGDAPNARYQWTRPISQTNVPRLDLRLVANGTVVVRDYPDAVSPAFQWWEVAQSVNGYSEGTDVGDQFWPDGVRLPPSPGDLGWRDRWRERPTGAVARRQARVWGRWYRRFVPAAHAQAQRAAGVCATRQTRGSYWSTVWFGGPAAGPDAPTAPSRALAVNGNGLVRSYVQRSGANQPTLSANPLATLTTTRSAAEATR